MREKDHLSYARFESVMEESEPTTGIRTGQNKAVHYDCSAGNSEKKRVKSWLPEEVPEVGV